MYHASSMSSGVNVIVPLKIESVKGIFSIVALLLSAPSGALVFTLWSTKGPATHFPKFPRSCYVILFGHF